MSIQIKHPNRLCYDSFKMSGTVKQSSSKSPLVSWTLAFIFGLFFGEAFFYFPLTLSLAVLSLLLGEAIFYHGRLFSFSLILVGASGFIIYQLVSTPFSKNDLRRYVDQGTISVTAEVSAPIRHAPTHHSLRMEGMTIETKKGRIPIHGFFQLNISGKAMPIQYGDQLEMQIRLRHPKQFNNPGSFLYADYRKRIGWSGTAYLSRYTKTKKIGTGGNPLLKVIYRWRERIRVRILSSFSGPTASMMAAMIIGETGYLSEETRESFVQSGTAHLLAVSGAHLAFVSLLVFALTRWILLRLPEALLLRLSLWKIPSQWAALVTALAVTFYAFLAGGRMSTLRALTMILIYLFSIWIGRQRDMKISLSVAALMILVLNPRAIFEISFQFSFLAVLSILLVTEWWEETTVSGESGIEHDSMKNKLVKAIRLMFLSSSSAALGLAPLTLFYFHQFSWVGLFSNLLLLPFAGWGLIPLGLSSAIASLFLPAPFPLGALHEMLWAFFFRLTRFFADLPGGDLHFASPPLFFILLFYGGILLILMTNKPRKWVFSFMAAFFLVFFVGGVIRLPPKGLRVSFLDVGQGDSALIEFPQGKTMLIDGGKERSGKFAVAPYLWENRIRTIDFLVGTHPQYDHIGGLPSLMRHFEVKEVWTNGLARETQADQNLRASLQKRDLRHRVITHKTSSVEIDGCTVQFLHPSNDLIRVDKNTNNGSIVLHISCPTDSGTPISLLFPGDIETEVEALLVHGAFDLKSTILKVPHHGSKSSSGKSFIAAVSPEIAVFSAGRKNRYGHPHSTVLSRYEEIEAEIHRTDQEGAIVIEVGTNRDLKIKHYLGQKIDRISWSNSPLSQEWGNLKKLF